MEINADQIDVLASLERRTNELAESRARATALDATVAELTATRETLSADLASVTANRDTLAAELATSIRECNAARAEVTEFNTRVQAELAKHGIRKQAAPVKPESDRKLTLTEQAIAARSKQ